MPCSRASTLSRYHPFPCDSLRVCMCAVVCAAGRSFTRTPTLRATTATARMNQIWARSTRGTGGRAQRAPLEHHRARLPCAQLGHGAAARPVGPRNRQEVRERTTHLGNREHPAAVGALVSAARPAKVPSEAQVPPGHRSLLRHLGRPHDHSPLGATSRLCRIYHRPEQ
jgi:hypothetical protein